MYYNFLGDKDFFFSSVCPKAQYLACVHTQVFIENMIEWVIHLLGLSDYYSYHDSWSQAQDWSPHLRIIFLYLAALLDFNPPLPSPDLWVPVILRLSDLIIGEEVFILT